MKFQEYWDTQIDKLECQGYMGAGLNKLYEVAFEAWEACRNSHKENIESPDSGKEHQPCGENNNERVIICSDIDF